MSVRESIFDVLETKSGDFLLKMMLKQKNDNFIWNLVIVYSAAHAVDKEKFMVELSSVCSTNAHPVCIGGDFNVIRRSKERNMPKDGGKWSFIFNAIIEIEGLKELEMSGQNFTWSNDHECPLYEKLDRILVSGDWEMHFPLTTVRCLERALSDHAPFLLDSGDMKVKNSFFFILSYVGC